MTTKKTTQKDVVGIGNAIVDVLTQAPELFLLNHGLTKGSMTLVEAIEVGRIHSAMGRTIEMSGGSVGNTMAAIASLGGTGSYIGKVGTDRLGTLFRHDLESLGITFNTAGTTDATATGCCLVIVTPDGQRSMATYLGACTKLHPEDIDAVTIQDHLVTYLEGYLWDAPLAKEAMVIAARLAHAMNRQVALSLSDSSCVTRHRESFLELIQKHVDILFANEQEIVALYETNDVSIAIQLAQRDCELVVTTLGAHGSLIAFSNEIHRVEATPVERVVDTTGAGDLYAAGFLFGITHGYDPVTSGRIGALAAAEIVSHIGARPTKRLAELIRECT